MPIQIILIGLFIYQPMKYMEAETQCFEESDKFNPSSPYSASKASAEHLYVMHLRKPMNRK